MWKIKVRAVSIGLKSTGYAHIVYKGSREITVAHHDHQNYDHIHTEQRGDGYVRQTGVGKREPDLTPHTDAVVVAEALNGASRLAT